MKYKGFLYYCICIEMLKGTIIPPEKIFKMWITLWGKYCGFTVLTLPGNTTRTYSGLHSSIYHMFWSLESHNFKMKTNLRYLSGWVGWQAKIVFRRLQFTLPYLTFLEFLNHTSQIIGETIQALLSMSKLIMYWHFDLRTTQHDNRKCREWGTPQLILFAVSERSTQVLTPTFYNKRSIILISNWK